MFDLIFRKCFFNLLFRSHIFTLSLPADLFLLYPRAGGMDYFLDTLIKP